MQRSPLRDLIVGIFVLIGLASIGYLSIQVGGLYYSGPSGFSGINPRQTKEELLLSRE